MSVTQVELDAAKDAALTCIHEMVLFAAFRYAMRSALLKGEVEP